MMEINYFSTFCLTDRTGHCLAVNLYNLAPGKGVIIGDTVAIAEPKFSHINVQHKDQVRYKNRSNQFSDEKRKVTYM